jgi:hypothetical protein
VEFEVCVVCINAKFSFNFQKERVWSPNKNLATNALNLFKIEITIKKKKEADLAFIRFL